MPKGTPQMASIEIADGANLRLGGNVRFNWAADLKNNQDARIQIIATQNGEIVYGEARPADEEFLLGGASSVWLQNGGSASCTATLYYWQFHPQQIFHSLAEIAFEAAG